MVLDTKFRMRSPDRETQNSNIRLAVLGSKGVGKTALTVRYLTKRFIGEYQSDRDMIYRATVAVDGKKTWVEILDLSSCQEDIIVPREKMVWAEAWIIVYSVTSTESFSVAQKALKGLITSSWGTECSNPLILLMANKKDLEHIREVSQYDGKKLAEKYGCRFVEVSASEMDYQVSDSIEGLLKGVQQTKGQISPRLRKLSVSKMINQLMNRSAANSSHNGNINAFSNNNNPSISQEKAILSRVSFRERAKRRGYLKNS